MEDAQSLSVQKEENFSNKTIIQLINIHTKNDNQREFNNPFSVLTMRALRHPLPPQLELQLRYVEAEVGS